MRISDWSSDVCSSDLFPHRQFRAFSVRSADIRLRHCLAVTKPLKKHIRNSLYRQSPFGRCARNRRSNMRNSYLFTSESVCEGHPDKVSDQIRSEEHTSQLQSLMRISYAVFCLKK